LPQREVVAAVVAAHRDGQLERGAIAGVRAVHSRHDVDPAELVEIAHGDVPERSTTVLPYRVGYLCPGLDARADEREHRVRIARLERGQVGLDQRLLRLAAARLRARCTTRGQRDDDHRCDEP
jgi:hypothetical protein